MHAERYTLPAETAAELNRARSEGRRIIAAGTTTVRTLEHCARAANGAPLEPHSREQPAFFISPGFEFRVVQAMLTNFHLPQSSLLMLVSAFAGREHVLAAYRSCSCTAISILLLRRLHVYQLTLVDSCRCPLTSNQAPRLPARLDVVHLSRLSRDAAAAAHVHAHRRADGGDLCLRQHDQQAAPRLSSPEFFAAVFDVSGPVFRDERASTMTLQEVQHQDADL